jgi:hypothetical protein
MLTFCMSLTVAWRLWICGVRVKLLVPNSRNIWIHEHETQTELLRNSKSLSLCTYAPLCGVWNLPGLEVQMDSYVLKSCFLVLLGLHISCCICCSWIDIHFVFYSVSFCVSVWRRPKQANISHDICAPILLIAKHASRGNAALHWSASD